MVSPVFYQFDRLIILDQTLLPGEEKYIYLETKEDVWQAIKKLQVRGAPAIGVAAAYGVYVAVKDAPVYGFFDIAREVHNASMYLATSRPTAVNLVWALN